MNILVAIKGMHYFEGTWLTKDGEVLDHDDVIKWKHFPRYWPFVRWIHRSIPRTKASDAELWYFLLSAPEQKVEYIP